ncbi:MAG: NAD-binding protein [Spirochaetaceae bacterium]
MKSIVIFGAGNIGRSFIGQLFSAGGFKVVFIDTNRKLVKQLNEKSQYNVIIKKDGHPDVIMTVGPVSAIDGNNKIDVVKSLIDADYVATSVGLRALPYIIPTICEAALIRRSNKMTPLDIILAENIHKGKRFFFQEVIKSIPQYIHPGTIIGVIECSIGKMVPIMSEESLRDDPLQLFAEEYNSLILDKNGFLTKCPELKGLSPVNNIQAYVDRKLFIHNLGHVATAYFGYLEGCKKGLISDVITLHHIRNKVRDVMEESATILLKLYPDVFSRESLTEHIEDLITRFGNRTLGDTIFRVGKDQRRKLNRSDRVLGAMIEAIKNGTPWGNIMEVYLAGLKFRSEFPPDIEFYNDIANKNPVMIGRDICGLDEVNQEDIEILKHLEKL